MLGVLYINASKAFANLTLDLSQQLCLIDRMESFYMSGVTDVYGNRDRQIRKILLSVTYKGDTHDSS